MHFNLTDSSFGADAVSESVFVCNTLLRGNFLAALWVKRLEESFESKSIFIPFHVQFVVFF